MIDIEFEPPRLCRHRKRCDVMFRKKAHGSILLQSFNRQAKSAHGFGIESLVQVVVIGFVEVLADAKRPAKQTRYLSVGLAFESRLDRFFLIEGPHSC